MNTGKNITRRVLSLLLALFIILPVCTFQGGLQVSAASVSGTIAKSWIAGYYFDFTGVGLPCGNHRGQSSMLTVDGKPAYCIELGEQVYTGSYSFSDVYNKLSTAEKKLLQYTLIYGYTGSLKYGYSKNVEYYATQILCWIIENGYYNNSSKSTEIINAACDTNPDKSDIKACITKIRTQIDDHAVIPSFTKGTASSAATQSLKYSNGQYILTLTDSSGAAQYYDWSDFKSQGITVSVSGNKVKFTASKIFTGTKTGQAVRVKSQYLSSIKDIAPLYLASSSNQDLVVDLGINSDPIPAYLKLNVAAGDLIISKTAEDGAKSGFKFHVTGNGIDETVTTGSNGKATLSNIPAGKYTVKESSVNDKYVTPAQQTVTVPAGSSVTASFTNKLKKFQVSLVKKDSESSSNPQGNASLDGAVYGLYEKDGTLLEKLTTSNGGKASSSYYPCQDGAYIQEITPPKGYLKDSTKYPLKAGSANFTIEKNTISQTVEDDVITGRIAIAKKKEIPDQESGTDVNLLSEENAEFQIYLKSAGSYDKAKETERDILKTDSVGYDQSKELPYGTYVLHQTKGDETTKFVDREITISENGKIYFYDLLNELKKARIKIIKIDSSTGNAIPMSGIKVKIKNLTTGKWVMDHGKEIFESTEDGTIELAVMLYAGKYEIYEVEAPESFAFLTEPLEFEIKAENCDKTVTVNLENTPQKGRIALYKQGEVIVGSDMVQTELGILTQPIYEDRFIGGAVYNIEAAEDIVIGNVVRHKKDDVIETLITKKGEAVYSGYLYPGNYVLVEQTPPDDMLLDPTPIPFTITDDEATEVIQPDLEITVKDNRPAVEISLQKSMEQDEHYQIGMYGEYQNIRFGLFTGEDVLDYDGNLAIPKDTLMFVCGINDDLKGRFDMSNIPLAKLYVKEIATDEHYILSDQQYPVEPARDNADQNGVISIEINGGNPIDNEIIRGRIEGMKIDQDGDPLPHTVFGLFRADEQDLDKDHALYVTESAEDGSFVFEDIPFDIYQLYELERVYGYEALTEPVMVEVTEDGQVIKLEVENTLIVGSVILHKIDEEFHDQALSEAVFEIIADSNQNKKYDPEDQVLGTMTETESGTYQYADLLEGGYFCHEAAPPEQFLADENYYYFEIRENGEVAEIKNADKGFTNKPETGELWITKTDVSNGKPLANVGFRIRNIETGEIAAEGYTGKDGVVKFKLRIGKYTYQEFDPLDGYRIDSRQFPFEIREDGQIIKAEMTNEKTQVPKTGDSSVLMIAASILLLGSGLILLVLWSRKRKGR